MNSPVAKFEDQELVRGSSVGKAGRARKRGQAETGRRAIRRVGSASGWTQV
jgi:hypothetical protein